MEVEIERRHPCVRHDEFVDGVNDLVKTVALLSAHLKWMESLGKWIAGLCVAMICLIVVAIFYAGALYQQVQFNTDMLAKHIDHVGGVSYGQDEIQITTADSLLLKEIQEVCPIDTRI